MKHLNLKHIISPRQWIRLSAITLALFSASSNVMADVVEMIDGHVIYIYGEKNEKFGDLVVVRLCPDLTPVGAQSANDEIKKACVTKTEYPRFKKSFFEKLRAELIRQVAVGHDVSLEELNQYILDDQFAKRACLNQPAADCEKIMGSHYQELLNLSSKMFDANVDLPVVLASIDAEVQAYTVSLAPGGPLKLVTASSDKSKFQPFYITEGFLKNWPVY